MMWAAQPRVFFPFYEAGPIKKEPCDDAPPCAKDSELEYAVFGDGIDN